MKEILIIKDYLQLFRCGEIWDVLGRSPRRALDTINQEPAWLPAARQARERGQKRWRGGLYLGPGHENLEVTIKSFEKKIQISKNISFTQRSYCGTQNDSPGGDHLPDANTIFNMEQN